MVEQGVQTDLESECEYLKKERHLNEVLKRALVLVPKLSNDVEAATEAARERARKLRLEHAAIPIERKQAILDQVQALQKPRKHVHPIALRCIFEAIFPPSGILDHTLSLGGDSPWCSVLRTKKALTLVCKEYRDVALPFLYSEIVLRRVGQLPALIDTIRSDQDTFAPMIRSINFAFLVPQNCAQAIDACATFLLKTCINLQSLSLTSAFVHPPDTGSPIFLPPSKGSEFVSTLGELSSKLARFEYYNIDNGPDGVGIPISILGATAFPNLIRLSIAVDNFARIPDDIQEFSTILFERVEDLCLWHTHKIVCQCARLLHKLELPRLTSLSFHWLWWTWMAEVSEDASSNVLLSFFKKNGHKLQFLDLSRLLFWPEAGSMTSELSSHSVDIIYACRSLRHLVLEERLLCWDLRAAFNCGTFTSTVHFDIWSGPSHDSYPEPTPYVRLLDKSLGIIPDLPRILPPIDWHDWSVHREPYFHNIFGISFVETPYMISRCDPVVSRHPDTWMEDMKECFDSDDSDYQPEDDLLDNYTTTSSESEAEDDGVGIDGNRTESEQMTEEDILKRFRASLLNYN